MKKMILSLLLAVPFLLQAQLVKSLKKTIELKMPGKVYKTIGNGLDKKAGLDSLPGTRGGAVVWHPLQKKYYAAFAGNWNYPMAVFDIKGNQLSKEDLTALKDLRGLWYDPKLKKICGNGYSEIGWFSYTLDSKGIPEKTEIIAEGMNQPDEQSIGTWNPKSNCAYFLTGQKIYVYNSKAMQEEDSTIRLYPGISRKENIDEDEDGEYLNEDYNSNVLVFTGIPKAEFGLLNIYEKQVELYNRKTGLLTQKLKLPENLPTWLSFNFSYSNGIYWAFDQNTRIWTGYK